MKIEVVITKDDIENILLGFTEEQFNLRDRMGSKGSKLAFKPELEWNTDGSVTIWADRKTPSEGENIFKELDDE